MSFSDILSRSVEITADFNLEIALLLFILCAIGEAWIALPYILETVWLLAGYQVSLGNLPLIDLMLIWLVAQAGRQTGSLAIYYSGRLGIRPLEKLYKKVVEPRLHGRPLVPAFLTGSLTNPSPFTIAAGRLIGLRLPVALAMSARRRLFPLMLGILISSLIWDGIYLTIGITVGATVMPSPFSMLIYSLGGLTSLYLVTLGVRYLLRLRSTGHRSAQ